MKKLQNLCYPGNGHGNTSRLGYQFLARLQCNMAAEGELHVDEAECENDVDLPQEEARSFKNQKGASLKVSKEERENRLSFLIFRDFLLHTRTVIEERANCKVHSGEEHVLYADDQGYLLGEFYEQIQKNEEVGFEGELSDELNLTESGSDHEKTAQNAETEIVVVPSRRFVREITKENVK